jgi:hypothetical protein
MEKYKSYFSWGLEGLTPRSERHPEQQFRRAGVQAVRGGRAPSVIDMLVAQHHCGINHLSMRVSWPGMGQDEILASIELLGRKVLPECDSEPQSLPDHREYVSPCRLPVVFGFKCQLIGGAH